MDINKGFEHFCGGQLWNSSLTWHTQDPTLTNCFLWTVAAWTPCFYLLLFSPVYIFCYLRKLENKKADCCHKTSALYVMKMIISLGLTSTGASCLLYCTVLYVRDSMPPVAVVTPLMVTLVFAISAFIVKMENDKSLVTSGFLSFFYFLLSISAVLYGYSLAWQYRHHWGIYIASKFQVVAYTICYALFSVQILVMLLLFCLPDGVAVQTLQRKTPNVCPELTTAFFGRIVFTWIFSLLFKGYRRTLTLADLWTHFDGQDATLNRVKLFEMWRKKKSLLCVLAQMFGPKLLISHAGMFAAMIFMFLVPFLLSIFIEYFDDQSMEEWKGFLLSVSFFVNYVFETMSWQQLVYHGADVGSRVKAALTSAAFQKVLLLDMSSSARHSSGTSPSPDADRIHAEERRRDDREEEEDKDDDAYEYRKSKKSKKSVFPATPGEAVNLISTDVHNIGEATAQLHLLWAIPVQTILVLLILWWLLSASVVVMVGIVCLVLAAIFLTSRFLKSLQLSQLKQKDGRMKIFTEVINGIKLLKLYTWEEAFEERVQQYRKEELSSLRRFFYVNGINTFSSLFVPNLTAFVTFSIYSWFIGPLDAKKAFTSMSLFNLLQYQLLLMPIISSYFVKAKVSLKRVEAFLQLPELKSYVESAPPPPRDSSELAIQIAEGSFSWDETSEPALKNINIELRNKSLTAVVGLVGSGKSSLLSAILGEAGRREGHVKVKGTVAYVSQQAWIQNATLRDNILFGLPYQDAKYSRIIEACALTQDLDILTAGDMTIIGEKGTNLSGGQKQRVSLARSLYQDCDIYLLDDPLSAVDSHVAKHIFSHVIGPQGYLKNKTRILVTHAVSFLSHTDHIVVLEEGTIVEQGSYNDLSKSGGRLTRFIETVESTPAPLDKPDGRDFAKGEDARSIHFSLSKSAKYSSSIGGVDKRSLTSSIGLRIEEEMRPGDELEGDDKSQIINPETVGAVKFGAYSFYASQLGHVTFGLVVFFFVVFKSFAVMSNVWISYWTGNKTLQGSFSPNSTGAGGVDGADYRQGQKYYISTYALFVGGHAFFLICYCIAYVESNINASRKTHSSMLHRVIRAPISFFESTPTGRILNRFSRDLDVLDSSLPDLLHQWLAVFTSLLSTIIIITMSIPIFFAVALILVIIFLLLQRFYLPTVRQLKWEESNSRSPIYALVCEALTGLSTVRAFKKQSMFLKRFDRLVNVNTIFNFSANAAERWLGFHLEFMGALTTLFASIFSVLNRGSLSGATVGMFMASSIQDSFSLCYLVRLNSSLETNMVSMERLKEYLQVEIETGLDDETETPPGRKKGRSGDMALTTVSRQKGNGKIEFQKYFMRYRPDLDYSLKNINVLINAGDKVGIIGRTGAGKSSLISALFRFNKHYEGFIFIDDVNTSMMPLKLLRSSMTVLPQDPIIFSGTIRMNLDPLSMHTDEEIWQALAQVNMSDSVMSLPGSLEHACQAEGSNFSVGQRQLLCLGRTLLHKTTILILDEATAAVDLETDKVIQETIRTQFSECTVLTIAHRINTILNCDRIMLLDSGTVKEYSSPSNIPGLSGGEESLSTHYDD